MPKSVVAVLRVRPETILEDIDRLMRLAQFDRALAPGATTILKDNISWHFPFPGANTTPWQLEGVIRTLRSSGYQDVSCVQNKTVVTNAFKGEDLNRYVPIFQAYDIPVLYNFKDEDMKWVVYRPKAPMLVLDHIFPDGILVPDYFFGKNIVHLPTVKCVGGDAEILLGDGSIITISELVDDRLASEPGPIVDRDGASATGMSIPLFAMTSENQVRACRAVGVRRTRADGRRVLRLRSRTGRTIVATEDHPVLTPEGWTEVGRLRGGDRVAIARRIELDQPARSQPIPQTYSSVDAPATSVAPALAGRTYSPEFARDVLDAYAAGSTVTSIAATKGVRWQKVQHILRRHGVRMRRNVAPLRIPHHTSPEFWRWIGYMIAEGNVERRPRGAGKLWWVNRTPEIESDFVELTSALFGLEAKPRAGTPGAHYVYSRRLTELLEEIGLPIPLRSGEKRIPPMLFRCPVEEIAAFCSAYLDGDGTVSAKQAEVSSTTRSRQLAVDLQHLWSRLGVVAFVKPVQSTIPGKWSEPRDYWKVVVSGEDLVRLQKVLRFRHPVKSSRLEGHVARLVQGKRPSNWDTVPLPAEIVRSVRRGLGLSAAQVGYPSSVHAIENAQSQPTPRVARRLVESLRAHDVTGDHADEIDKLDRLCSPDLAWDHVLAVEEVDNDLPLYDVTVPAASSFVASGFIVHNCHIYTTTTGAMKNAFGGLLNTKRHYTHSWIHQTLVDLLAIQKEIHSGLFAVMDGTTAGNGPGPRTMYPEKKNVMLASSDQVAIDAVAAKMMGFDPLSLDYIRLAHERGLGVGDTRDIEIVGDLDAARESWGFRVGDNGASRIGDVLWFGPLKGIQNLFFRTPLVNLFIFGSEAYHDYYRWPLRDRRVFEKWLAKSEWGHLFSQYGSERTLARPEIAPARR